MNIGGVTIEVADAVSLIELAAKLGAHIYKAIESNGSYSDAQKAALIARVKAAGNYVPRDLDARPVPHDGSPSVEDDDIPDPAPTRPVR